MFMNIESSSYTDSYNYKVFHDISHRDKSARKKPKKRCFIFFKHKFAYQKGFGVRCVRCGRTKAECFNNGKRGNLY